MPPTTTHDRPGRSRSGRVLAGTVAATLAVTGLSLIGAQSATAAGKPQAQAVGNFLDAKVGNQTLDQLVSVKYASAKSPGSTSVQNPLDATALGKINVPLTGVLQFPSILGIDAGGMNQVAHASPNGQSFGAAGAVNNYGGAAVGGDSSSTSASAGAIDVSADDVTGDIPIPGLPALPGLPAVNPTSLNALGNIQSSIGAVSALAQTPAAGKSLPAGQLGARSSVAGFDLALESPALGALLGRVTQLLNPSTVAGLLGPISTLLGSTLPTDCALTGGGLPTEISLDGDSITVSPASGAITIHAAPLLKSLTGYDMTAPNTSNFDLIDFLARNLGTILSTGLTRTVTDLSTSLQTDFAGCLTALGPFSNVVSELLGALNTGFGQLTDALGNMTDRLNQSGSTGLDAIGAALKQVMDIGLNVQSGPRTQTQESTYAFSTKLGATAKQGTPVVAGQTLVRAMEIHVIGDPAATVGLANAAAGPGTAAAPPSTTPTTPGTGSSNPAGPNGGGNAVPTGIPAGLGTHGGSPVAPIVLLIVGLVMAAGGAVAFKVRATRLG